MTLHATTNIASALLVSLERLAIMLSWAMLKFLLLLMSTLLCNSMRPAMISINWTGISSYVGLLYLANLLHCKRLHYWRLEILQSPLFKLLHLCFYIWVCQQIYCCHISKAAYIQTLVCKGEETITITSNIVKCISEVPKPSALRRIQTFVYKGDKAMLTRVSNI